jgi:hypothetical protein
MRLRLKKSSLTSVWANRKCVPLMFLTERNKNIDCRSNLETAPMAWMKDAAATAGLLAFIVCSFGLADVAQAAFAAI